LFPYTLKHTERKKEKLNPLRPSWTKSNKTHIPIEAKMFLVSFCNIFIHYTSQPNYF